MAGIGEGIEQVVVSGDAAAVLRRAGELAIYADGIHCVRLWVLPFLQQNAVLPAITEVVSVDYLGAVFLEHGRERHGGLAFHPRVPHEWVRGFWAAEAPLTGTELVHVFVVPSHHDLQHVVQLRQAQTCRNQYAAPDGRLGAKQSDLELIDILCDLAAPCCDGGPAPQRRISPWGPELDSMLRYGALRRSSGHCTAPMR